MKKQQAMQVSQNNFRANAVFRTLTDPEFKFSAKQCLDQYNGYLGMVKNQRIQLTYAAVKKSEFVEFLLGCNCPDQIDWDDIDTKHFQAERQ